MAYDPAEWHDFYVMTGGAAAALTGLLFSSSPCRSTRARVFFMFAWNIYLAWVLITEVSEGR